MTDEQRSGPSPRGQHSSAQAVRDQTKDLGHDTAEIGGQLAHKAREQGSHIAAEAGHQARDLLGEARNQLRSQADTQQHRAAAGLRHLGDEICSMVEQSGQKGLAADLAGQASKRINAVAGWLEQRESGSMLEDVREYARRHPGAFLAGAALLGGLAGRLTRNAAPHREGPGAGEHRHDGGEHRPDGGGVYQHGRVQPAAVSGMEAMPSLRHSVPEHEMYSLDEPTGSGFEPGSGSGEMRER